MKRNKFLAKLFVALIFGVLLYQDKSTVKMIDYAVREAVKHNKNNLAYIEGICKKRKEKESVKKSLEESRQKKREQYKDLTPEERKSWSNLNLLQMVYSQKPATLSRIESSSG